MIVEVEFYTETLTCKELRKKVKREKQFQLLTLVAQHVH